MLAANGIEADFLARLNVYKTMGLTLLAIFALIWLILRIRSWFFESDDSDEPLHEMLTQFRQLKRDGELTEEEYRLISQRLSAGQPPPGVAAAATKSLPTAASPESGPATDQSNK